MSLQGRGDAPICGAALAGVAVTRFLAGVSPFPFEATLPFEVLGSTSGDASAVLREGQVPVSRCFRLTCGASYPQAKLIGQ